MDTVLAALRSNSPRAVVVRFAVLFVGLLGLAAYLDRRFDAFGWLMAIITVISARLLTAVGVPVQSSSAATRMIVLQHHSLSIAFECTAVTLMLIYASLVIAYPFSWPTKMRGLLIGLLVIQVMNLARIVGAGVVSQYWPQLFDPVHDFLFQGGMVLVVIALWVIWLADVRRRAG